MPRPQDFIELAFTLPPERIELCIGLLAGEDINYFQEDENMLFAYLPEEEWTDDKKENITRILTASFGSPPSFSVKHMADRNWNAEWEAHLEPIDISDKIRIVQKNEPLDDNTGRLVIRINPKMSFGTGYHATTRLMLRQLESLDLEDKRILDIGTGTGILAIACRKLGSTLPILAVDNNDWAIDNARENVTDNNADNIDVAMLDAEDDTLFDEPYDLILANINRNVIGTMLPAIRARAPQSRVLVSGILVYDESWLRKLIEQLDYSIASMRYEDEWLSCLFDPVS